MIGFARQFPGQMSVDLTFLRRNYKDRPALVDQNGIYDGVVFKGYIDETLNDIYLITNNTYSWFVYSGLEVSVSKRTKNMQVLGGYTRGWQHLDGTWQPHDPASFIQPDAFANDKGLGTWRGNNTSSLSYSADTRSPSWQKHVFRRAAATTCRGGSPWRPTSRCCPARIRPDLHDDRGTYPKFGPSTVTLSNGRKVPNPLATTYRFASRTAVKAR